jgi:hypothetical protein
VHYSVSTGRGCVCREPTGPFDKDRWKSEIELMHKLRHVSGGCAFFSHTGLAMSRG